MLFWVGNLPPGAKVVDLKDYFSQGATDDIESMKLMSKTNCAFANYRTEEACEAAAKRFDGSLFHNRRLICRLRKRSASDASQSAEPVTPISSALFSNWLDEGTTEDLSEESRGAVATYSRVPVGTRR